MKRLALFPLALLLLSAGSCMKPATTDVGCEVYGAARSDMPRPLPDDPLGRWVGNLDSGMTGGCR